jgi:hypothetical protein
VSLVDAVEELIEDTGTRPVLTVPASHEVGEVLRAAALGRKWLETVEAKTPDRLPPLKCFILGYLAAVKDRT